MIVDLSNEASHAQWSNDRLQQMATELWLAYHRILWQYCCRHQWTMITHESFTDPAMDRDEARLVQKAQTFKEQGRIDAAVELLSKALSIRPQYRAARFVLRLGKVHRNKNGLSHTM